MSEYAGVAVFAFIMVLWLASSLKELEERVAQLELKLMICEIKK